MRLLSSNLLVILLAVALTSFGCKKDEASPSSAATSFPAQMVGTWVPVTVTVNGAPLTISAYFQWVQGATACQMVFSATGSYTYTETGATNNVVYTNGGTLTVSGNSITVTRTSENGQQLQQPQTEFQGTWGVAGNQLTLTNPTTNAVLVFTKT